MEIKQVTSSAFGEYGRVLTNLNLTGLLERMKHTPLPSDVVYVPSEAMLEEDEEYEVFSRVVYGEMPIQIGYCNGHNQKLNAVEYHRDSEINVAVTDMILLIGRLADVSEAFEYDTAKIEAFLVPAGTAVEIYATTLHYAPCGVDGAGFRCAVVLPRGTNYDLKKIHQRISKTAQAEVLSEDYLLAAANKWLIAHEDAKIAGAWNGLKGENIEVAQKVQNGGLQ